jgi:hypothetical protein
MGKHWISFAIVAFCAATASAQPKAVQPAQRPDIRPGDLLEVIDMGKVREAEFVEFTPVGLIKVRFDDDSQMAFRPTHVRFAKGVNPRGPNAAQPAVKPPPVDRPATPPTAEVDPANPFSPPEEVVAKRKWKDASGQFSIEAEFIGLANGKVDLKKADGKVISIPLEKLAAPDLAVAQALVLAAKTAASGAAPAGPKAPATTISAGPPVKIEVANYRETVSITEFSPDAPWQGRLDPRPDPVPALYTEHVQFEMGEDQLTNNRAELDDVHHHAWIMVEKWASMPKQCWFERIDLKTGERLTPVPAMQTSDQLWSVSPSGRFAAIGTKSESEVHILDLSLPTPRRVRTIRPFHEQTIRYENNYSRDKIDAVFNAVLLDDDHLFVQDSNRRPALIYLKTLKVIYRLKTFSQACFSPGRKHVAMSARGGVFLLEAMTGKNLGMLESPGTDLYFAMAFHPDGTRLGGITLTEAIVWDVATGKPVARKQEVNLGHVINFRVGFGKDYDHLVNQGQFVFSMKTGKIVQLIPGNNIHPAFTHGGREWYLTIHSKTETVKLVGIKSRVLPDE